MYVLALIFSVLFLNAMVTESKSERRTCRHSASSRVWAEGGREVRPGEFPFLALILLADQLCCTASIPSRTTLLTCASHDMTHATAYAGITNWRQLTSDSAQGRCVCDCILYSTFKMHDIRICYVDRPWLWTPYVQPVKLYLQDVVLPVSFAKLCQVVGFGEGVEGNGSAVARVMDQLMSSELHCVAGIGAGYNRHLRNRQRRYFHTYGMCSVNVINKTLCDGDEGGPVMCTENGETTQWGVVSTMLPTYSLCRAPVDLNSYAFVAYYRKWIRENIKDLPSGGSRVADTERRPITIKASVVIITCGFLFL